MPWQITHVSFPQIDPTRTGGKRGEGYRTNITLQNGSITRTLNVRVLTLNEGPAPKLSTRSPAKVGVPIPVESAADRTQITARCFLCPKSLNRQLSRTGVGKRERQELIRQISLGEWDGKVYKSITRLHRAQGLRVEYENQIGRGSFGSVHPATLREIGPDGREVEKSVVVKTFHRNRGVRLTSRHIGEQLGLVASNYASSQEEDAAQTCLKVHGLVVKAARNRYLFISHESDLESVARTHPGSSIVSVVMEHGGRPFDQIMHRFKPRDLPLVIQDIFSALSYLHSLGIIHHDVKPENLLLKGGVTKLADFGLSKLADRNGRVYEPSGTYFFMAPEIYDPHTSKVDVWSAGLVLMESAFYAAQPKEVVDEYLYTRDQIERNVHGEVIYNLRGRPQRMSRHQAFLKRVLHNKYQTLTQEERENRIRRFLEKTISKDNQGNEFDPEIKKEIILTILDCLEINPQERLTSRQVLDNTIRFINDHDNGED